LLALLAAASLSTNVVAVAFGQSADGAGDGMNQPVPQVQRGGVLRGRTVDDAIAVARSNAAQRAGITADQVNVISVQPTEWPDVSLGCPSAVPTAEFAQVVTPGYIILLDAAGTSMTYHTDAGLRAIPCDVPPIPPALSPDAATD
jgi:hypothetical protein